MNAAQFFEAARRQAPKVFSLQLLPFTVGHYLFLAEIDSPFLPGETREPTARDALIATFICAGPSEIQRQKLNRDSLWFYWWVWRVGCLPISAIADQADLLRVHIYNAFDGPAHLPSYDTAAPVKAISPHVLRLISFFMEELHQPRSEILGTPLWEATSQRATWLDRHGEFNTWTEERETLWQHAAERDRLKFGGPS